MAPQEMGKSFDLRPVHQAFFFGQGSIEHCSVEFSFEAGKELSVEEPLDLGYTRLTQYV